jgi:[amino group carrier protein]-L-2-aminoadipate 6-kinase
MEPIVVKVGGANGVEPEAVCADVAALAQTGQPVVLVHGVSAAAAMLAARVGLPVRQLTSPSGHVSRHTDPETLEIYVAAVSQVNKRLVGTLQRLGCNAIGLTGMDGRLLKARRKAAIRVVENGRQRIVRDDYTGQLEGANAALLRTMLDMGYVPVIAPLAIGEESEPLNVDGDRAAALVAGAMRAETLVLLSNVPGLLERYPDESSLIRHVPEGRIEWAETVAQGRMKKKVLAAREALAGGVGRVILGDSRRESPVLAALNGEGTVIGRPVNASFVLPIALSGPRAQWEMAALQPVEQERRGYGPEEHVEDPR